MPDPERKTLSSTEVPALRGLSPYTTHWMLYQRFKNGASLDSPASERMNWGNRLQPVILEASAEVLQLDVEHVDAYVRSKHAPIGCTADGLVTCPTRGEGVVEAKNVDRWVHRTTWSFENGRCVMAPPHIEIQVQLQMYVLQARWGVIAALIGGNELLLLEREFNAELCRELVKDAVEFFVDLDKGNEPDVTGTDRELKLLTELYPKVVPEKVVDLVEDEELYEAAMIYREVMEQRAGLNRSYTKQRAKILQKAGDAGRVLLTDDWQIELKKAGKGTRINVRGLENGEQIATDSTD